MNKRKRPLSWRYKEMYRVRVFPWKLSNEQRENLDCGIRIDFKLPHPYPRNEHEDGINMVAVYAEIGRPVMSGRADW